MVCNALCRVQLYVPYILSYESKNVGQILALETRGLTYSSFGQKLFQGYLCKLIAMVRSNGQLADCISQPFKNWVISDSIWPICLTACWSSCCNLHGCADADRQGATLLASFLRHCLQTTHLLATTASSWVAAAASRHRLHAAGCSATAMLPVQMSPQQPGDRGPTPVSTYMRVSNFERF